ncbi:MAG: tryptophan--tRNA ligase [Vampirovibrionales bacterium]|nr:tryptophan--tRNA ligase [Vampirovibrionales bacterium]
MFFDNEPDDHLKDSLDTTTDAQQNRPVILMSGMRPTGRLHLGHYVGVIANWLKLQTQHPSYFMIADWHALTTQYASPQKLNEHTLGLAIDWLAAGIDPETATLYVQSWVPEILEINALLSMATPVKWLETDPTLKDMVALTKEDLNLGLLGYPVLQTADILSVGGTHVPVGKDQLAHLEVSRDIARRMNHLYGAPLFAEPKPMLTETPLLMGLDGRKMGKSLNNGIYLSDTQDEVLQKIKREAITDTQRVKRNDPGTPSNCPGVFPYYQIFAPQLVTTVDAECRSAARGCMDCKKQLTEHINALLAPMHQKRAEYEADKGQVIALLKAGSQKAREQAQAVLGRVKAAMNWRF